jgi:hypothetical protein
MIDYHHLLDHFDAYGLEQYDIGPTDLEMVHQYITILQAGFPETVWDESLRTGGIYGTSILIHEIVEIRGLFRAGIDPFTLTARELARCLEVVPDAHVQGLWHEHLYLRTAIRCRYGQVFEVATLMQANEVGRLDVERFWESDVGVYLLEKDRIAAARAILEELARGVMMVRYRLLERLKDDEVAWEPDSYAIENQWSGQVEFRCPMYWEHLGRRVSRQVREQNLSLAELDKVELLQSARRFRWLPIETAAGAYDEVVRRLDAMCHIRVGQAEMALA